MRLCLESTALKVTVLFSSRAEVVLSGISWQRPPSLKHHPGIQIPKGCWRNMGVSYPKHTTKKTHFAKGILLVASIQTQVPPNLKVILSSSIFSKGLYNHKQGITADGEAPPCPSPASQYTSQRIDGIEFSKSLEIGQENCEMFILWESKNCTSSVKIENKNKDPDSQCLTPSF